MFVDEPVDSLGGRVLNALPDLQMHHHPGYPLWEFKKGSSRPRHWVDTKKSDDKGSTDVGGYTEEGPPNSPEAQPDSADNVVRLREGSVRSSDPVLIYGQLAKTSIVGDFLSHESWGGLWQRDRMARWVGFHAPIHDTYLMTRLWRVRYFEEPLTTTSIYTAYGTFPFASIQEKRFDNKKNWGAIRRAYLRQMVRNGELKGDDSWETFFKRTYLGNPKLPSYILARNWEDWIKGRVMHELDAARVMDLDESFAEFTREIPERSYPVLVEALESVKPQIRWNAESLIARCGHPNAPKVIAGLFSHKDPVLSIRSWSRIRFSEQARNQALKILNDKSAVKTDILVAVETLAWQRQARDQNRLLELVENKDNPLEIRIAAMKGLMLQKTRPVARMLEAIRSIENEKSGVFIGRMVRRFAKSTKGIGQFSDKTCKAYMARKNSPNGAVLLSEDFPLMFVHLVERFSENPKDRSILAKFITASTEKTMSWELRSLVVRLWRRVPGGAPTAKEFEGLLKKYMSVEEKARSANESLSSHFYVGWASIIDWYATLHRDASQESLSRIFRRFCGPLTKKTSGGMGQPMGQAHKKVGFARVDWVVFETVRRHLVDPELKFKEIVRKLISDQHSPKYALSWLKIAQAAFDPSQKGHLNEVRTCLAALNDQRVKRLFVRSLAGVSLGKKSTRKMLLELLSDPDPLMRYHVHRLLERATGKSFFMSPERPKNGKEWAARWEAILKEVR